MLEWTDSSRTATRGLLSEKYERKLFVFNIRTENQLQMIPQIITNNVQSLPFLSSSVFFLSFFLFEFYKNIISTVLLQRQINLTCLKTTLLVPVIILSEFRASSQEIRKQGNTAVLSCPCASTQGILKELWRALWHGSRDSIVILSGLFWFAFTQTRNFFCEQHFQWRAKTFI